MTTPLSLTRTLADQLTFHRRWQTASMAAYFLSTILTIACSSSAVLFGAKGDGGISAILAAVATISIGVETLPVEARETTQT